MSGVLDPYVVSCGANPAVFGLLAVMTVELFQSWAVVPNRGSHLAKLLGLVVVGFVLGSLPFVDNMSQLGGFCFGLVRRPLAAARTGKALVSAALCAVPHGAATTDMPSLARALCVR